MGVVNTVATTIADEVTLEPWRVGGTAGEVLYSTSGHVSVAAADSDTSTYRFCRIPGKARVVSIRLFTAGITGGTSFDFGLYVSGTGVAMDVDCYASAVDLSSAHNGTELAFEARAIANHRKKAWEDCGDSADPGTYYDLVATANTVGSATADVMVIVQYAII